jgi:sugar phosphate isomerase/epimerase
MRNSILVSTTSHKREPLQTTLEVYARLGMTDIDLNLHHLLEKGVDPGDVKRWIDSGKQKTWIVSGGWCDFFHAEPQIKETFTSVARQVEICKQLGSGLLRLFFGRLTFEEYSIDKKNLITANLQQLSDLYPEMTFVFENHDGASLHPGICLEIMQQVDRPNIRLNFDPINFERVGVDHMQAMTTLIPFVEHVHLKGLENGKFCEFGCGDINLATTVQTLLKSGYNGMFTVEYEGEFDGTVRLYQSSVRARALMIKLLETD